MKIKKITPKKIINVLKKEWYVLALIVFVIVTRYIFLHDATIPFGFDHGKDSLAVFHMWTTRSLKFIGPWTSIPGLYFGPAWYYLLLPGLLLFNWSPVGSVWMMVLLICLQIYLAKKYFGKLSAFILATGQMWLTLSESAWNPFPMTLISFLILILLKEIKKNKKASNKNIFILSFCSAMGFHFSAAFAIFYPPIIIITMLVNKIKFRKKMIKPAIIGWVIPFTTQILFELKNGFSQTKGVISYFIKGESHALTMDKLENIIKMFFGDVKLAISANIWLPNSELASNLNLLIFYIVLAILAITLLKKKKTTFNYLELAIWTVIPLIGFMFLHFNFWYMLAMYPIWLILIADSIKNMPKVFQGMFVAVMLLTMIGKIYFYTSLDKQTLVKSRAFLPPKVKAINLVKEKANGRAYVSYHYVPDVYDFSYQYIYFWQAKKGDMLPVDFSYKPNSLNYVVEKAELLQRFDAQVDKREVEVKYYIVEEPFQEKLLEEWWGSQSYNEIINEYEITPEITVYEAI